jgi:hypothetical protein
MAPSVTILSAEKTWNFVTNSIFDTMQELIIQL